MNEFTLKQFIFVILFGLCSTLNATAEPLIKNFDEGNYLVTEEDREFAIRFSDAARVHPNQDIQAAFPGIAVEDSIKLNTFKQIMPVLEIDQIELENLYNDIRDANNTSIVTNDQFEAFKNVFEQLEKTGQRELEMTNEEAFQAYLRGTFLLDSQIKALNTAIGDRRGGEDQHCWWPFCPRVVSPQQ